MDPRAVLHPVGPLPARTYWLRRLAPLAILLALLIVVAVSCSGGGSAKKPTAASGPTGSPTPSFPPSTRSSTTGTGTPPACTRAALEVTASTDATKYPAGSLPRLVVTVRNTGLAACTFTDGPSRRVLTLVSGADQIWTSEGCASSKLVARRVMAPGLSVKHTLVWNRHRSGKDCATSDTVASPGTYQLVATVDGVRSSPAVFHLTG